MNRFLVVCTRICLVLLLLGSVLVQVLIPLVASELGAEYPETSPLVVPYSVAAIVAIACVQIVLVAIWRLLSLSARGAVFGPSALRWPTVIGASTAVATLLSIGVTIHLVGVAQIGGPGMFLALLACDVIGTTFVLIMVVLRGLLQAAIDYRHELDEVI